LITTYKRTYKWINFIDVNESINKQFEDYYFLSELPNLLNPDLEKDMNGPLLVNYRNKNKIKSILRKKYKRRKLVGISYYPINPDSYEFWKRLIKSSPKVTFIDLQFNNLSTNNPNIFKECEFKNLSTYDDLDLENDIDGLATVIANLDHIVTIPNIIAHLAGRLEKEGVILIQPNMKVDWYYGTEQTPWYKSMRLVF